MYALVLIIHLLIALALCVVVLLQSSKGDGLAGAFGGAGGGQAVFGARGVTTLLHKATIYLAVAFMVSSVSLVFLTMNIAGSGGGSSLSQRAAERVPVSGGGAAPDVQTVPTTPGEIPAEGGASGEETAPQGGDQSGADAQQGGAQQQGGGGDDASGQ